MGKPIRFSKKEITTMIERAEGLFSLAPQVLAEDIIKTDSNNFQKIIKQPIGTSLIISPWNYPLLTTIGGLVASILCGNPVLLKHSVRTPLVGQQFEDAFNSVGALNVVQHLFLENDDIPKVMSEKSVKYIGFTGSVETGRVVQKAVAETGRFINLNLELGGKDAAYVREDADVDFAVASIVDGCMFNSGQSCCAIERVYVHSSIYEEFVDKAAEIISNDYKLGDPLDENTNLGPMALPDAPLFIKEHVEEAVHMGAEIVVGGSIVNDKNGKGRFFEPTLIKDCRRDMLVMRKESFGPLMCVSPVDSDDEAIDLINNCEYGLTNAVYSKDKEKCLELAEMVFGYIMLYYILFINYNNNNNN